jgi:hypothetical protein
VKLDTSTGCDNSILPFMGCSSSYMEYETRIVQSAVGCAMAQVLGLSLSIPGRSVCYLWLIVCHWADFSPST